MHVRAASTCDLDGTLLGRGASLLHDADGAFTLLGARALEACARAGAEVVLYSGRRAATLLPRRAHCSGMRSYIFEAGAGFVLDGELRLAHGRPRAARRPDRSSTRSRTRARRRCCSSASRALEYHAPWHVDRDVSHLFRGQVDAAEADALLEPSTATATLRLVDNGAIVAPMPGIARRRAPTT